jgi:hypothetical protein
MNKIIFFAFILINIIVINSCKKEIPEHEIEDNIENNIENNIDTTKNSQENSNTQNWDLVDHTQSYSYDEYGQLSSYSKREYDKNKNITYWMSESYYYNPESKCHLIVHKQESYYTYNEDNTRTIKTYITNYTGSDYNTCNQGIENRKFTHETIQHY